jgi:hypothetical protein
MTRILTPLWDNPLKKVLIEYASRLNEFNFDEFTNSNTIIHLIDSLRVSYSLKNQNLITIELNHSFKKQYNQWNIPVQNYSWKKDIDIKFGQNVRYHRYIGNYLNIISEGLDNGNQLQIIQSFINDAFKLSFENERDNCIFWITDPENIIVLNQGLDLTKPITIETLKNIDPFLGGVEQYFISYENQEYSIILEPFFAEPLLIKYNKVVVAYLVNKKI